MTGERCATVAAACLRVIRLPGGTVLNRYYDDRAATRDESYAEDVATAAVAAPRHAADTWRDLRAAAESGWDFSSRWLDDPQRLATIRTTAIVPVDLNSLLYTLEARIAAECAKLGDTTCAHRFALRAQLRVEAMHKWLWRPVEARFADYDWVRRRPTPVLSAATLYPLFTGVATPVEAKAVARTAAASLLAPGGLRTTGIVTGQQRDRPNGWAPLQLIAVAGLDRFGDTAMATTVACRFLSTVTRSYAATGKMLEKYDVEEQRPGGGGKYPTHDGFGWTNGVTRAQLARGARHQDAACSNS